MRVNFVFQNSDMSKEQAENVWAGLRKGITEIQNGNASQLRFEELYRNSYTLVLHKHGDLLYEGVKETIRQKLESVSEEVASVANAQLVETTVEQWEHHKLIMTMIRDILMYMDKTYCEIKKQTPVYDMGFRMFRDQVVKSKGVSARLREQLLLCVEQERNNQAIDRMVMKNCLRMLVHCNVNSHQVYIEEFENHFIQTTETFYKTESQNFILQNNCPDYLRKVEERLGQEEERAEQYLDPKTKSRLMEVCERELITTFAEILVKNDSSGCIPMFDKNMIDDLARMYRLFSRIPQTLEHISGCLKDYVKDLGTKIVTDPENKKNPKKFVQEVLDLRKKYHNIVSVAFDQNRNFERHLKEAFEHFINLDMRAAQYLSLYIDEMLKKGLRGVSEAEIEDKLRNVVTIFRYLSDKDIFEDFYKQHLAARLLMGKRISDDIEKTMIAMLKAECGHQFTSKLEGMFKDMDLSKEMNENYRSWSTTHGRQDRAETMLSANVLTTGFWPFPDVPECNLPKHVVECCKHFKRYYTNLHSGRRLKWNTSLGNAELLCVFNGGRKELLVHTYQMCILMMYNDSNSFTLQQIQEKTNIPQEELERHLLSLAHPKIRVLVKHPNTKVCAPNHTFKYNNNYKNKLYRVKIPLLAPSKSKEETERKSDIPDGVMEARKNRVEASIVRIMKARKVLNHNNLIAEVCKHLSSRFISEPAFIKKRIESLIEREYLERDKDDRRTYRYLA